MKIHFSQDLPPENYRRLIKEYATILQDSTLRLKFTRNVLKQFHSETKRFLFHPAGSERAFRRLLKAEIEKLVPRSGPIIKEAIRNGHISRYFFLSGHMQRPFHPLFFFLLPGLMLCIAMALFYSFFNGSNHQHLEITSSYPVETTIVHQRIATPPLKPRIKEPMPTPQASGPKLVQPILNLQPAEPDQKSILHYLSENPFSFRLLDNPSPFKPSLNGISTAQNKSISGNDDTQTDNGNETIEPKNLTLNQDYFFPNNYLATLLSLPKPTVAPPEKQNEKEAFPEYIEQPIWLVEKTKNAETYSNGLQINTSFTVKNISRNYVVFPKNGDTLPGNDGSSNRIRGVLYHTSEGDMVPLKPEKNRLLKKYTSQLVSYISRKKGYHYIIDRFGRVYRIVREKDAAFHAGNAVWADKDSIFLNLNHAFLGICFEGKDFEEIHEPGSTKPKIRVVNDTTITQAQIQSGKELTDWLRFHYKIPQNNCIPHAIASVYPKDRLIGYHLDLAHGFPFHRFGLQNKYRGTIPSIVEFGFRHDRYFNNVLNGNIWPGIILSEKSLKSTAKQKGLSYKAYRQSLHERFDRYYHWQKYLQNNIPAGASANNHTEATGIN